MTADLPPAVPVLLGALLLVQAGTLAAWLRTLSPPAPIGVAVVAGAAAVAADVLATFGRQVSLAPLTTVLAIAVLGALVVQLARGVARVRVTESIAATLTLAVVMIAGATLLTLLRQHAGVPALLCYTAAVGLGILLARSTDRLAPRPRLTDGVPRGAVGILLGITLGTAAAAGVAWLGGVVSVGAGAVVGCGSAAAAVLADLGVSYAIAERRCRSREAALLGPLLGLAAAAPVAYVLATLVLD